MGRVDIDEMERMQIDKNKKSGQKGHHFLMRVCLL